MDLVIENPGFSHIGEKIFKCLDFNNKSTCRLVKKSWKNMLERKSYTFDDLFNNVRHFERVRTAINQANLLPFPFEEPDDDAWRNLISFVHTTFRSKWIDTYLQEIISKRILPCPLAEFALVKNVKMIEFTLESYLFTSDQFIHVQNWVAQNCDHTILQCFKPYYYQRKKDEEDEEWYDENGFGFGPGQGPANFGWAGPAQIALGPENFGPNPSLLNGFGFGPGQGPTNFGWAGPAQIALGPDNFGPNPSLDETDFYDDHTF